MNDTSIIVPPTSWATIEQYTHDLTKALYPQCHDAPQPFPIEDLVAFDLSDHFKIDFRVRDDLPVDIEGIVVPGKHGSRPRLDLAQSTYDGMIVGTPRDRFTAAHEVGHAIMHAQYLTEAYSSGRHFGLYRKKAEIPAFRDPECQANVFANRILVPTEMLRLAITHYGVSVVRLAALFQVSKTVIRIRLREIGALT